MNEIYHVTLTVPQLPLHMI